MSARISFRDRASGKDWPRLRFVKGWEITGTDPEDDSVECGEGTAYPVEVTGADLQTRLDIIAEIFYRAHTAQITEFELINGSAGDPSISYTSGITLDDLTHRIMWGDSAPGGFSGNFLAQGYWAYDDEDVLAPDTTPQVCDSTALPFLSEAYTVEVDMNDGGSLTFRDIESETALWWYGAENVPPTWNQSLNTFEMIDVAEGFRTAFSWHSRSDAEALPTLPIPWCAQEGLPFLFIVQVVIRGGVAYTGDSPFDPDGRLFLDLEFKCFTRTGFPTEDVNFSSLSGSGAKTESLYIMRTSIGEISCPIYIDGGSSDLSSGNVVHEVVQWWPYKTTTGSPVWNAETGAPINGGPGA